ncbi:MAG: MgtC/SapB family protein, partial [Chloroflexi bacterium]|nr:MgtC/SapB family protein [Chloroflexota bacterium]
QLWVGVVPDPDPQARAVRQHMIGGSTTAQRVRHLPAVPPERTWFSTVEPHIIDPGLPDCNGSAEGRYAWMEHWQLTPWVDLDAILRLLMAAIAGGVVGWDRERIGKPAGVRTLLLVCVGAALLTVISIYGFAGSADPSRLAAAVVIGIGFLGAGVILHSEKGVVGLTTAAAVWMVSAIGVAFGAGLYLIAVAASILVLIGLRLKTKSFHE